MRSPLRNHHGKTALVLAGGGLSGAMYEIGALRAIDDILTDRTVNDFDIYVGTSAGAIACSLLANGATPESMLQGLSAQMIYFDLFSVNSNFGGTSAACPPAARWPSPCRHQPGPLVP